MSYIVYKIEHKGIIYYGHTKDLDKRSYQHNYLFKKSPEKKLFYDTLNKLGFKRELKLVEIDRFKTKADAKRKELMLILDRYFKGKQLYQKIPSISDR